jgi:hypothetical protein
MMHRTTWVRRGIAEMAGAAPLALAPMLPAPCTRQKRGRHARGMERLVAVEDVQSSTAGVSGKLVNRSTDTLLNVRLMVTDQFQWTQERQPGTNDPGGGGQLTVAGPIPPRASVPFHIQRAQPLPTRSDGTFKTDVSVLGVTKQEPGAAP